MDIIEQNTAKDSMFKLEEVQLQFQIQSSIVELLVKNNILYLVLINGLVYRIYLDDPEKVDKIQIDATNVTVTQAFLDPAGYHLIVHTSKNDLYYLNIQNTHFKHLSKLKGLPVSSVLFFDSFATKNATGPVLLSTLTGVLYEIKIDSNKEKLIKQVWKSRESITKLLGLSTSKEKDTVFYQVLVSLGNNKLCLFKSTLATPTSNSYSFFASGFKKDPLVLDFNSLTALTSGQTIFAFLEAGEDDQNYRLIYGDLDFKTKNELNNFDIEASIAKHTHSIMLTKYHIMLLLDTNELLVYNHFNGKEVSRQLVPIDNKEQVKLTGDYKAETYWLNSPQKIFEIVVDNESSDIWRIMTEKKMYDQALALLSHPNGSDAYKRDLILISKGRNQLENGLYDEGAQTLAATSESFETVALRLIELKKESSLRLYLLTKLRLLPKSYHMQRVMLSSWIVELYIEKLNELENKLLVARNGTTGAVDEALDQTEDLSQQQKKMLNEFYDFLEEFKEILDKDTIYQIIISHNRKDELLYFSNLLDDYNFVLKYYLNLQQWDKALEVLTKERKPLLIYKCSTALLINYPVKTIDTWIRLADDLDFKKLLPSILTYNKSVCRSQGVLPEYNQALRFLNFIIKEKQSKDKIVHNTLLSILITYPNSANESLILKYLEGQQKSRSLLTSREKSFEILFDTDFVLRLCFKHEKYQSAIYIYSMLENYEDAINLALDNDLMEVAILVADKPTDPLSSKRKKLWLKIAEKLIQKVVMNDKFLEKHQQLLEVSWKNADNESEESNETDGDGGRIKGLLKFLMSKCEMLTMKDLLPLFPDFIVIDNFKEEIVRSLESLSLEMHKLSNEMNASLKQSEKINLQIKEFHDNHFQIIEPRESCSLCGKILIIRKFIVFPCLHSFHQDCLVREILDSNDYKFKNAIYKLEKKITFNKSNKEMLKALREETDTLLSTTCCLCSDVKINSIEEPLIKGDDREQNEWALD